MTENLVEQYGEELASAIADVEKELKDLSGNEFEAMSEVSNELLEKFLIKNSCNPPLSFKEQMKTPFSIARYLILFVQQKENIKFVKNILEILLAKTNINYSIYEDFSNQICFSKDPEVNSTEKPQCLVLKYRIDKEAEKVTFVLPGNNWGWDINNSQLLAILTGKYTESKIENTVQKTSKNDICLTFNGVDILIRKSM